MTSVGPRSTSTFSGSSRALVLTMITTSVMNAARPTQMYHVLIIHMTSV